MSNINKIVRYTIARLIPGQFPQLYSTLDNPIEVPVQVAAYNLVSNKFIDDNESVLDVGSGLGYGMRIMASRASAVHGLDIDERAVNQAQILKDKFPAIIRVDLYDGVSIPYENNIFDVVTCIDVLEHVPDYLSLIHEMIRVCRKVIIISTPIRRPEYTRKDGMPVNRWHLREWSFEEFDSILRQLDEVEVEWNFLNGPWAGPFDATSVPTSETLALAPVIYVKS